MGRYTTDLASINNYQKGGVTVIDEDPKRYAFSNIFEVAATSQPFERVCVGKNFEYVIEAVRAEGTSSWYAAAHDEFVLSMDDEVEVHLVKLHDPDATVDPESGGARKLPGDPDGEKMGRVVLRQGHMAILPVGAAYRFSAPRPCTLMIQTIDGPETVHKWAEICQH
ncbi:MAG TPA: hydroxyquinol 1,2-dioxygenase [Blastocatellia bacterium]|nr:hydroxyquinol 1,2-dioxygenase [Blastocatellia bacterium]